MITNKAIPFRPKLEGEFRIRFYDAVDGINEKTSIKVIEEIVVREVDWAENVCTVNLVQRRRYRAVWMLFRDLIRASWKACYRDGVLEMLLPSLDSSDISDSSTPEIKTLLRSWMQDSRLERLALYSDFITRIETATSTKKAISELIVDGAELEARLQRVVRKEIPVEEAVSPYLQLVTENDKDAFTGQRLSEIWRYFRLTWSTPAETTPGRTMQYLIRDAAHPMHAVMGIASLENCAVQITCRDNYIGWNSTAFIEELRNNGHASHARTQYEKLLGYLQDGINGIDFDDLCAANDIEDPTDAVIGKLQYIAVSSEEERQDLLKAYQGGSAEVNPDDKSELGNISKEIEQVLYKRKRADQLAKLLGSRKAIREVLQNSKFDELWLSFADSENGNSVIRTALIAQKAKHIGSSMMELNVCGAIPPYNEILGGKLVALLATSPQVIRDYKERYSDKRSEIASRLKGEDVCRAADLVYIGTTSLYYVGSSQYNRLKIPGKVFGTDYDVKWKELGMTVGFGTMHISKATTLCLTEATNDGFSRINHVFGEGASPKMRLMTMAIRELLETTNGETKDFSKHAMSRIVYGAEIAKNTIEYLMGDATTPDYYFDTNDYDGETLKIIRYWQNRWVISRLNYTPIFERIRNFDKQQLLVSTELKKASDWKFEKLKEPVGMNDVLTEKSGLDFIRDFYRGSSAYADFIDQGFLSRVHVVTELDGAIIDAVKLGKDVVLTGNPGDGKTHIIRMLHEPLNAIDPTPIIELDASVLSNAALYSRWKAAREQKKPFVIAINAAVLLSLAHEHKDFEPVVNAANQMISSTVYHDEQFDDNGIVVFDLSKREALENSIVKRVFVNMTKNDHFAMCMNCQFKELCPAKQNVRLIQSELFQDRLCVVLTQVALQGHHATLRELQAFVSYLIFGNRPCSKLTTTSSDHQYDVTNLIYSGKGKLFDAIREAFDPAKVSHPIWDERLLLNAIDADTWIDGFSIPSETLDPNNSELFNLRKRQFYFFNVNGSVLLDMCDDGISKFQRFLALDDKAAIKELIVKLNAFFGTVKPSAELEIWTSHRFNNAPRRILMSIGKMKRADFQIGRPVLNSIISRGIRMVQDFVRLEKKTESSIYLKVDYTMYSLLLEAERGVPVLLMESDIVKRIWRFVEQLQDANDIDDDEVTVSILDVQGKKEISVTVDRDSKKYVAIASTKNHF